MEMQSKHVRLTLVHGTFDSGAAWSRPDSTFVKGLQRYFDGATIEPTTFTWSGRNSLTARNDAILRLRRELREFREANPASKQFVIGHSHGGTIAYHAAHSLPEGIVDGVACLSTPFLNIHERTYAPFAWGGIVLSIVLIAVFLARTLYNRLIHIKPDGASDWHIALILAVMGIAACLIALKMFHANLRNTMNIAEVLRHRSKWVNRDTVLLVRTAGDEASIALSAAAFFNWLWDRSYSVYVRPAEILETVVTVDTRNKSLRLLLTIVELVTLVTTSIWAGLGIVLCAPLVLISMLAFGMRLGLLSPMLEVTVESTPIGEWSVALLNIGNPKDPFAYTSWVRRHSSYERTDISYIVAKWMANQPYESLFLVEELTYNPYDLVDGSAIVDSVSDVELRGQ